MRKIFLLAICLLLSSTYVFARRNCHSKSTTNYFKQHTSFEYDFRRIQFGMTRNEILLSEEGRKIIYSDSNIITYGSSSSTLLTTIQYYFYKNICTEASIFIHLPQKSTDDYIDQYENIKYMLRQKYGEPTKSMKSFLIDKIDEKQQIKHLISIWKLGDLHVSLNLEEKGYSLLALKYYDPYLINWAKRDAKLMKQETNR